ncbi:hypothetical protein EYF80_032192 [Liparis tanakae]|uniref:Uncharacterized protein n=1 Tax=Liparis tanakae TaxID=230148 RepID=A0A4Z2GWG2_9TELE|nr:hypothetical protein EYF80_032192 [Liparis tanakae]
MSSDPSSNPSAVTSVQTHVKTSQPFLPPLRHFIRRITASGQCVSQRDFALQSSSAIMAASVMAFFAFSSAFLHSCTASSTSF